MKQNFKIYPLLTFSDNVLVNMDVELNPWRVPSKKNSTSTIVRKVKIVNYEQVIKSNNESEVVNIAEPIENRSQISKKYKCEFCDFVFPSVEIKIRHLKRFHKSLFCVFCERKFSSKDLLEDHILTVHKRQKKHVPEPPKESEHKCELCDHVFTSFTNRIQHLKRNHIYCFACDLTFTSKNVLEEHNRIAHRCSWYLCERQFNALCDIANFVQKKSQP